uniref:NR LBD domain-containing protein n=2 Tax=Caenorhabditis tropicalis TaxID=1561998 RepID=A0A1I7U9Y8_9PELO
MMTIGFSSKLCDLPNNNENGMESLSNMRYKCRKDLIVSLQRYIRASRPLTLSFFDSIVDMSPLPPSLKEVGSCAIAIHLLDTCFRIRYATYYTNVRHMSVQIRTLTLFILLTTS